ncbi:MAG: hypothetical protein JWO06_61 [Bacteroidota bacterium]|nr:hypothetical protein [Bacteroidota bacterium]
MLRTKIILCLVLLLIMPCSLKSINAQLLSANSYKKPASAIADSGKKNMTDVNINGIKFVDLTGLLQKVGDKYVLVANNISYRLASTDAECLKYIGQQVKVSGVLMQGYDNPKYGKQNLPISQIDPADVINIISSVHIQPNS